MKKSDWGRISPEGIGGAGDLESAANKIARANSGNSEEGRDETQKGASYREPQITSPALLSQLYPDIAKRQGGAT